MTIQTFPILVKCSKSCHTKDPEETALIIEFFLSELENLFNSTKKFQKSKFLWNLSSQALVQKSSTIMIMVHNDTRLK